MVRPVVLSATSLWVDVEPPNKLLKTALTSCFIETVKLPPRLESSEYLIHFICIRRDNNRFTQQHAGDVNVR